MSLDFSADILAVRLEFAQLLFHRCTVTTMRAGVEDEHYDATPTPGDPIIDVPCTYSVAGRTIRDIDGTVTVLGPTMMASATGPIKVGARIENVTDSLGTVMDAGPLRVERVLDATADLGASMLMFYELRAVNAELS